MTWRFGGADLSHYQDEAGGLINWDVLKAGSLDDYAATKATQRHNYVDPTFIRHRENMRRCKFRRRPLYHWQSPTSEASIAAQVALIKKTIGTLEVGEAFMADSEQTGITEPETFELVTSVEEFTHRPSILYFGIYTAGGALVRSERLRTSKFGRRPIHIAAYVSEAILLAKLKAAGLQGLKIDANQWGSSGILPNMTHVPGVVGRCDMNQLNDFAAFDIACGYGETTTVGDYDMKVYGNNQVGKYGGVAWPTGGCSLYTITPDKGQLRPLSWGEWVLEYKSDMGQGVDDSWLDLVPAYTPDSQVSMPDTKDFEVTSTVTSTVARK